MLPSERGDVLDHVGRRGDTFTVKLGESRFEIERIPIDDGALSRCSTEAGRSAFS